MPDDHLEQVAECWRQGKPLDAGRLIFENLPPHERPKWAARILKLVLGKSRVRLKAIDAMVKMANDPAQWSNAHDAFSTLREATLALGSANSTKEEQLRRGVLALAELVAKVTYNASNPPDEFDEDSGWWIAHNLRAFVDWWSDDEFSKAAWSALCAHSD